MGWTVPRTWTTGELLTSGQLNTHIRDNERYLHGDDGPIDLIAELRVPALKVNGVTVDPGIGGGTIPDDDGDIVPHNTVASGPIPVGGPSVRLLGEARYLEPGQRYLILARASIEAGDALDLNFRAEVYIGYLEGSPATETVLEQAFVTIPSGGSPANRDEVVIFARVTVPDGAFQPYVRMVARKNGGTGSTIGRGLALTAFPI